MRRKRKEAIRMLLKRLIVWFIETSLEDALLGVVLVSLFGCDQHAYGKCLAVNFVWLGTMFFSAGYLLTTGIARAIWRGRDVWPYSVVATVLFFIHFEILNYAAGGAFDPAKRSVIRVVGACIVFACTLAGTFALRNWTPARSRLAEPQAGGPA
jgi:hypothetical protein